MTNSLTDLGTNTAKNDTGVSRNKGRRERGIKSRLCRVRTRRTVKISLFFTYMSMFTCTILGILTSKALPVEAIPMNPLLAVYMIFPQFSL